MKSLIEYISKSLVDDPDRVQVNQYRRASQVTITLEVAKDDMGRIIGKSGKVAGAMRALLKVAAAQEGVRATLEIVEPE